MRSIRFGLLCFVLMAVWIWGCSGSQGVTFSPPGVQPAPAPPAPNSLGLANVGLDESRATKATVGTAGGSLSTTGPDGSTYTLAIPAGVLVGDTEIGMFPLTSLAGLETPHVVGVHLTPEGLHFDKPVTLTIALNGLQASQLVGFSYSGNGLGLHRFPVEAGSGTLTFLIPHFSGYGGADNLPGTPGSTSLAEESALGAIALSLGDLSQLSDPLPASVEGTAQDVAATIRDWYTSRIRALLDSIRFTPDRNEAMAFLDEYSTWRLYASGAALPPSISARVAELLQPEVAESLGVAGGGVRSQFDLDCQAAASSGDLADIDKALEWYARARSLGLDSAGNRLDQATVLNDLPLRVVFEQVSFPEDLEAFETGELRINVGYRIGNGATRFDHPLLVLVTAQNGVVFLGVGIADGQGNFATDVQRTSNAEMTIAISALFESTSLLGLIGGDTSIVLPALNTGSSPSPSPSPSQSPSQSPTPPPFVPLVQADIEGTWEGSGIYTPGNLAQNITLIVGPGSVNGAATVGGLIRRGRDLASQPLPILGSITVNNSAASSQVTVAGTVYPYPPGVFPPQSQASFGFLSARIQRTANDDPSLPLVLTGQWTNFDAGGTVFDFTATRTGP